ncbi:hypothetical protein [Sagittula sp. S175]|uniref:hypothetical protein n=1 Tax=Sagittula sp. S175 TaxID=3415129 RepID=UPI003C7C509D
MTRITTLLAACLTLIAAASQAAEVLPSDGQGMGCGLRLSGLLEEGDADRLGAELDRLAGQRPPGSGREGYRLCLDSPGGSLIEATLMADLVAERGFGTAVPAGARCESACAVLFMAGQHRPPETDVPFTPDRLLHPQGKLGFHAPSLTVPEANYTQAEVNRAYTIALASIAEVVQLRARRSLVWPDSLLLGILGTPPQSMTYVDTVGLAARWQIEVAPVALPSEDLPLALSHACLNADGGMMDQAPQDSWYHGKALTFRFDGFGDDYAELHSVEGFREEGAAPCAVYLQASDSAIGPIGAVVMEGGSTANPSWRGLYPYALYDAARRIETLPEPTPDATVPFFSGLSDLARQALGNVTFESCWVASPEAKVVNVDAFVNLRAAAGFDGSVLREVPLGERLRVLGTQSLHMPGGGEACLTACNALAMNPDDTEARASVDSCVSRNLLWYEVQDATGQVGFISRKYLAD